MTDHLNQAREIAECAQNWGSPDDRSIPYALHGITHALIAIAEALQEAHKLSRETLLDPASAVERVVSELINAATTPEEDQ